MIYGLFGDTCIHCEIKPSLRVRVLLMAAWGVCEAANSPITDPNTTPDSLDLRVQLYG